MMITPLTICERLPVYLPIYIGILPGYSSNNYCKCYSIYVYIPGTCSLHIQLLFSLLTNQKERLYNFIDDVRVAKQI